MDLIVIGCSAGGVKALITLVGSLSKQFRTPICIAQHVSPLHSSRLPALLTSLGSLPASHPPDGTRLVAGAIFLAPPDHHLVVRGEQVMVAAALQERPSPSVNRLFASAASSYGPGVIGVILTGMLTDGTAGLQAVKQAGGTTIIQYPLSAAYPSMPQSARDHCSIDYCFPLAQIAALLQALAG